MYMHFSCCSFINCRILTVTVKINSIAITMLYLDVILAVNSFRGVVIIAGMPFAVQVHVASIASK